MLRWVVLFLVSGMIARLLGLPVVAEVAFTVAQVLFLVLMLLVFVSASLLLMVFRRQRPFV